MEPPARSGTTTVISRHQKKLTTVLVVDEAHHVSTEVLEEIRLLTNLETTNEKLLQILLVGQPELDEKLDSIELRFSVGRSYAARLQLTPPSRSPPWFPRHYPHPHNLPTNFMKSSTPESTSALELGCF
jgi:hypothetical protein